MNLQGESQSILNDDQVDCNQQSVVQTVFLITRQEYKNMSLWGSLHLWPSQNEIF